MFLVSCKNNSVMERNVFSVKYFLKVFHLAHLVITVELVETLMAYLDILKLPNIIDSFKKVFRVVVFIIITLSVLELSCKVLNDLLFLLFIVIIWINQHEQILICQREVLSNLSLLSMDCVFAFNFSDM